MEEELSEVHLDLSPSLSSLSLSDDPLLLQNLKLHLHMVNQTIDSVYTTWSSLPSHPEREKCGKYLKTGICPSGAKCRYDHPFHEKINDEIEDDLLLFLTYITERLMKILKSFSFEAAVDVLSSLCKIVQLLEFYYEIALTHPSYGQICYLYGDVIIRLSVDIDNFCSNKLSQKRTTPRYQRKGPQLIDPNLQIFENCSERLEVIYTKWLDWEEEIRKETMTSLHQLDSDSAANQILHQLSSQMVHYAHETLRDHERMRPVRENIRLNLLRLFRQIPSWASIPDIDLLAFGSHANLLGTSNSDMDLTLQLPTSMDPLAALESAAKEAQAGGYIVKEIVKETRVPVLKLSDEVNDIEIDIVVNNNLALHNTSLLRHYALCDPRVRPLVMAVKRWAKCRGCNNPRNASLTSYAWTLMVLYFLRTRSAGDSLPSIEEVKHVVESQQCTVDNLIQATGSLSQPHPIIGKLLVEFFAFYGTCSPNGFQPFHSIVSLRNNFRVYKKSSHLHTGEKVKSAGDVLRLIQAIVGEADTARLETDDITKMVAYSLSPSWRFCIEDPYEEHDLGRVIYCLSGQIHMMNEMKRTLTLFNDLVVKYRLHHQGQSDLFHENKSQSHFNFWDLLLMINESVPIAIKTCSLCGQQGHFSRECDLMKCHLCNEKGHFMKDCIRLFCSNCRQQGHFAKDCKKERLCRYCKQPGHDIKECPHKSCTKCGSKNHTTIRCRTKTSNVQSPQTPIGKIPDSEEKIVATPASDISPEIINRPRKGRVPPLSLETKMVSMAKLAGIPPINVKLGSPESPILGSPFDSPVQYPSDAKLSASSVPSESQREDLILQQKPEIKENPRKKKNRKEKSRASYQENMGERRDNGLSVENQSQQRHPSIDLSSTNSTPRETITNNRKRYQEIRGTNGATTSARLAQAIRSPALGNTSFEDKREIKTSVYFESNEGNTLLSDAKPELHGPHGSHENDAKIAAPKIDSHSLDRRESKTLLDFHQFGAKPSPIVTRVPSDHKLLSEIPNPTDFSAEFSDPSIGSPVPLSPMMSTENKQGEEKRETKGNKRNRRRGKNQLGGGEVHPPHDVNDSGRSRLESDEIGTGPLESPAPAGYRKRIEKRDSKLL